jgi:hypothetical protein
VPILHTLAPMGAWTCAWIIGGAVLLVGTYLVPWRRSVAIRALADRNGFKYLGTTLPGSISRTGTPFAGLNATSNVIDGDRQGIGVVAFDCKAG